LSGNADIDVSASVLANIETEILKVTQPTLSVANNFVKPGETVTITASGSHSPDSTNIEYHWTLPDGSTHVGNSVILVVPATAHEGDVLLVTCRAVDDLGNKSPVASIELTVVENYPPIIQNVQWDKDTFVAGNSYEVEITAVDPEMTTLTYELLCSDTSVTISQISSNKFSVTFPEKETTYSVEFTYRVSDADGKTTEQKETKIVLAINEQVISFPEENSNSVYLKNTPDELSALWIVEYSGKAWVGLIDIEGNVKKQFEVGNFQSIIDGAYKENKVYILARDSSGYFYLLHFDVDGNFVKGVKFTFPYFSSAVINDNTLYTCVVGYESAQWGRLLVIDPDLNMVACKKIEYNIKPEYYSDSYRRFMKLSFIGQDGDRFRVITDSAFLVSDTNLIVAVGINNDGTVFPIGFTNIYPPAGNSRYSRVPILANSTDSYVFVALNSNLFHVTSYFDESYNALNYNWIHITHSTLTNKPIVKATTANFFIKYETDIAGSGSSVPPVSHNKITGFDFLPFESVAFSTYKFEMFIGKTGNKGAILKVLQAWSKENKSCGGITLDTLNIRPYKGDDISFDSSSDMVDSNYQLYYYDLTDISFESVTETQLNINTSPMKVVTSCKL
jgi:hypothetical protein